MECIYKEKIKAIIKILDEDGDMEDFDKLAVLDTVTRFIETNIIVGCIKEEYVLKKK